MFNIDYSVIKTDKVNTSTIHNYTIFCIFNWCVEKGLTPILEKPEKYFLKSEKIIKNGKIDVGAFYGDEYKIAFEVDFSFKPQSLAKLKLCDAQKKYWLIIERDVELINKNYFIDDIKVIFLKF